MRQSATAALRRRSFRYRRRASIRKARRACPIAFVRPSCRSASTPAAAQRRGPRSAERSGCRTTIESFNLRRTFTAVPPRSLSYRLRRRKLRRVFAKPLDQHLEQIGEAEQNAPDRLEIVAWLRLCRRDGPSASRSADDGSCGRLGPVSSSKASARDDDEAPSAKGSSQPQKDTARIVASQPFERPLFAALSVQFTLVHVSISFK